MYFEFGDFVLDESNHELRRQGAALRVDNKVFALLAYMVRRAGQLVTHAELVENVWEGRALSETVLSGAVSRARKVLGQDEGRIVNVHGLGYRFTGPVSTPASSVPGPSLDALFVGRAGAQATIRDAVQQARSGRGSIVVIVGEPGIGKTHLAEVSAETAAEEGASSAWGHCPALETCPPFWPIVQALRAAQRGPSSAKARDAIENALSSLVPESSSTTSDWSSTGSVYRRFDAITAALRALADDRPWMLLLDDLQWADAASLRYLAYVAPEVAHLPVVVLGTARNTEPDPDDLRLAHVLGHRNCKRLELQRLTPADVAEYVTRRLGRAQQELSRAVFAKSEGNPFFMLELLRSFAGSELPKADELSVSGAALDIVRQRTRALGESTTALLSAAAVIGRDFDVGLLAQVTEREPQEIKNALAGARAASIVVYRDEDGGHYTFGHDLIRSVLLEGLTPSDEGRLHLRTAEGLQRRYPGGDGPPRSDTVHHLLSALPLGDVRKTIALAKRAALAVADACAHADAALLLRRALAALELASDPEPRLRCELLLYLSRCERAAADARFAEHLTEAAAIGQEHGLGEVLAEAGRHMSLAPGFTALEGAREVLEAADRALSPESKAERADVLAHLAWTAPYCFDRERAAELVDRAVALARECGSKDALCIALSAESYFSNGPDSRDKVELLGNQLGLLYAERPPLFRVHWNVQVEFSRIATSLQR
ncbi:MAG TPA: BREX system ATP-binding domain-containing protein, partial [Polyangiaceae bacterium]|nr:BREX system ATP-binding domain-containing protein [Polyangiaceae bacterium]